MIVQSNTPWETYPLDNPTAPLRVVWVKREDLCCPLPGPSFSKIRGIEQVLSSLKQDFFAPDWIGGLDTYHSKAGWGLSYLCQKYDLKCAVYYPQYKNEAAVRPLQRICERLGAEIIPLPATKSAILYHQAKKDFMAKHPKGFFMPNGLKLRETIVGTSDELTRYTPKHLVENPNAVWVISVSSGTIAAGVALGLTKMAFQGTLILHLGYSRSIAGLRNYLKKMTNNQISDKMTIHFVDENYEYKDMVDHPCPFPCNPYYDRKAWKWLSENINKTLLGNVPVVFWNIGS